MVTMTHSARVWDAKIKDFRVINVLVEVDTQELAHQYAAKAYINKSRVAKQCHGAVKVTVKGDAP